MLSKQQDVDVDLLREYADVLLKWAEINLSYLVTSEYFSESLNLFSMTLEKVDSKELNSELVKFFSYLLNTVSIKFRRLQPEALNSLVNHYSIILRSLLLTLTKADIGKDLANIALALKNTISWAEQGCFEDKLRQEFIMLMG